MALPKFGEKKNLWDPNCGNAIAEIGRKKNCFGNCGNGIAENGKKKRCYEIYERVKKKLSRPQYFYNIFTINHTWLVIISLKNMWQTNCGNCIAKIGRKKKIVRP